MTHDTDLILLSTRQPAGHDNTDHTNLSGQLTSPFVRCEMANNQSTDTDGGNDDKADENDILNRHWKTHPFCRRGAATAVDVQWQHPHLLQLLYAVFGFCISPLENQDY